MGTQLADQPLSTLTVADLQAIIRKTVAEVLQKMPNDANFEERFRDSLEYVQPEGRPRALKEAGVPWERAAEGSERRAGQVLQLTALIEREGDGYVAACPEVDVVSQGQTVEEARRNLIEAVEGFFEVASPSEIRRRLKTQTYVVPILPTIPSARLQSTT